MKNVSLLLALALAVIPFSVAPGTVKPKADKPSAAETQEKKDAKNIVATETRKFEVITKATLYYFHVDPKVALNTCEHTLEFITEDRLKVWSSFEEGKKHSDAAASTCQPVKELLEILKVTQQELLLAPEETKKAVIVKFAFQEPSQSALVKFEFKKNINESDKTVESLSLTVRIFGYNDEVDPTLLNFIKACALENTLWQNTKPFILGSGLIGTVLFTALTLKASLDNATALKAVSPIFEGLGEEIRAELERYHKSHPAAFADRTQPKYEDTWFREAKRVEPWFAYTEPALHEGVWHPIGLTFASNKLSEKAHKKEASVVATAWLPGSLNAMCQTTVWEEVEAADQDRILVVPASVLASDIKDITAKKVECDAQVKILAEEMITAISKNVSEMALIQAKYQEKIAALKALMLPFEWLNQGQWTLVVVNDGQAVLNLNEELTKDFLADLNAYVVITSEKLTDAATKEIKASCKVDASGTFEVTATRDDDNSLQETLAHLVVHGLFSTTNEKTTYSVPSADGATSKTYEVSKTEAKTLPSRRHKTKPADRPEMRIPLTIELPRDIEKLILAKWPGAEMYPVGTTTFTQKLQTFLNRKVTIAGKQSPRIVFVPASLLELCDAKGFAEAVNKAQATVIVANLGETDEISDKENFLDVAQKALATFERAVVWPLALGKICYKKPAVDFTSPRRKSSPRQKVVEAIKEIYA